MNSIGVERRNGNLPQSCAECRRSKLKCDRQLPACSACIRRGCAALCPDGVLNATKGNKVLAAHASKLSDQVKTLSARVEALEKALAQTTLDGTHPLLTPNVSEAQVTEAIGSLSIGLDGQAKYHGETAGSEYFQGLLRFDDDSPPNVTNDLGLPPDIIDLMNSFPFGLKGQQHTKYIFLQYLPSHDRAIVLVQQYYTHAAWMYDPIVKKDFMDTIFNQIYGADDSSVQSLHPHRLAVFFVMLATGALYDDPPNSLQAEQYHALARAAISVDSLLDTSSNCATVQALFMMLRFIYTYDREGGEARWIMTGLCVRISQTIGLQRDSAGWNLEPEEVQRRRVLIWEIFTYDAWTSLVNGRPPSMMIQHTDAKLPEYTDPDIGGQNWHIWKSQYASACLSLSVQHVFSTRQPSYSALGELDKQIRQFPVPERLRPPTEGSDSGKKSNWSVDVSLAMQQYGTLCIKECNLLYIHRSYFTQAIRQSPQDPLKHKFGQSVAATYRSALRLIWGLKSLYVVHERDVKMAWFFWSGLFSSCIVLGALVVESSGSNLAKDAFINLKSAIRFYDTGSEPCRPPATMTMLSKLESQAEAAMSNYDPRVTTNIADNSNLNELTVLQGQKTVINRKSPSVSPPSIPRHPADQFIDPNYHSIGVMDNQDVYANTNPSESREPSPSSYSYYHPAPPPPPPLLMGYPMNYAYPVGQSADFNQYQQYTDNVSTLPRSISSLQQHNQDADIWNFERTPHQFY